MLNRLKDNTPTIVVFALPVAMFVGGLLIVLARNGRL